MAIHGTFEIETFKFPNGKLLIEISTPGFWCANAKVWKTRRFMEEDFSVEVQYGAGGEDDTMDNLQAAHSKMIALRLAVKIARSLKRRQETS